MRPDGDVEVYLCRGVVDMRKSINGLSVLVEEGLGLNPFGPQLFAFCNRKRDKLKILYWERSGFVLWYKQPSASVGKDQVRGSRAAVRSTDRVFESACGKALFLDQPIQRAWRDVHAAREPAINDSGAEMFERGFLGEVTLESVRGLVMKRNPYGSEIARAKIAPTMGSA